MASNHSSKHLIFYITKGSKHHAIATSTTTPFNNLKERVASKLSGWKEKFLSMAGKEVLIKAVFQAITTHTMSCFLLPKSLCDELNSMWGMGFRDLRSFNLALLSKQVWRLQQGSNSLFYKVFKSKCFPKTDFVNAQKGRYPSYVWHSILATQPLVNQEMRWQVGDGKSIRIWKDKRIPTPSTFRVISPRTLLPIDQTVDILIDTDRGTWIANLVRELFINFEAETILSIPPSIRMPRDKMVWAGTPNGQFTVKSAYWLAQSMSRADHEGLSGANGQRRLWKTIWGAENTLPTKSSLCRRQVINSDTCEQCDRCSETTSHVLLHCDFSSAVWKACGLVVDRDSLFVDCLWKMCDESELADVNLTHFMAIAWNLKKNKNRIRHGEAPKTVEILISKATQDCPKPLKMLTSLTSWLLLKLTKLSKTAPPRRKFSSLLNGLPLCVIFQDDKAMEAAMLFARDMGIHDIVFEGDSLQFSNFLKGSSLVPLAVANVLEGILFHLQFFRTFCFSHIRKVGNKPAHLLAQHAKFVSDFEA
ncbi:hypothetical protein ACB092_05G140400 [Castanea dentata]